jgi:hypothetical protein
MNSIAHIAFTLLEINIALADSEEIAKAADLLLKFHVECQDTFTREQAIMSHRTIFKNTWDHVLDPKYSADMVVVGGKKRKLQSIVDVVLKPFFANKKITTLLAYIESIVSKRFLMFIQGITLFHDDGTDVLPGNKLGRPAYHREASCGPNNGLMKYKMENLYCLGVKDLDELRRRKRNVWNCMIERKIYNQFYERYISEQDFSHRFEMNDMERRMFESCFPLMEIVIGHITVNYDPIYNIPIALEISYRTRMPNGTYVLVMERYEKAIVQNDVYALSVKCKRTMTQSNNTTLDFFKTTSFLDNKKEWTRSGRSHAGGSSDNSDDLSIRDPWIVSDTLAKRAPGLKLRY